MGTLIIRHRPQDCRVLHATVAKAGAQMLKHQNNVPCDVVPLMSCASTDVGCRDFLSTFQERRTLPVASMDVWQSAKYADI